MSGEEKPTNRIDFRTFDYLDIIDYLNGLNWKKKLSDKEINWVDGMSYDYTRCDTPDVYDKFFN